jgi:outer membrane receptor protein involved in Fe transport
VKQLELIIMTKQKISVLFSKPAVLLLLLLAVAIGYGQTPTATLSGVVRTMQGEVVKEAIVTLKNNATGKARQATTDKEGRYIFPLLEPGSYEIKVQADGFKLLIQKNLILNVGGTTVKDVQMEVGGISEQVNIDVMNPLTEPNKTDVSRVVAEAEIQGLPNIGRNFVDFVKLSSGVALGREQIYGGPFKEPDSGIGSVAAPRLSFAGQSELNTLIQVDGADNVQTVTGTPRATPSQEAASEFRVLNSTYLAEYGRALGGFVNIITRSGANNINGSVYYFGINDALNARSILNVPGADVLRQNQYGATIGGPIKKDSVFYFVNYEGQRRDESNRFAQLIQQNLTAINAFRSAFNLTPETINQVRSNNYDQFLVKVDQVIGKNALSLRYNFLVSESENFLGLGSRSAPLSSTARDNDTTDQSFVGTFISALSPRASNEARLQVARRDFEFPSNLQEPTVEVATLLTMGRNPTDFESYLEDRVQVSDNFSYARGAHQLKFGGDYNYLRDRTLWNLFFPARIIFPTLPRLLNFRPALPPGPPNPTIGPAVFFFPTFSGSPIGFQVPVPFTQALPDVYASTTDFTLNHSIYGGFVQDQWKVTPKLNLTLGVRYDVEGYPSRYTPNRDYNNVQPRVGLAYSWNPKGVVRAGFGLFNDRLGTVGQGFATAEFNSRGDMPNASVLLPGVTPLRGRFISTVVGGPPAQGAAINFLTTGQTPTFGNPTLNIGLDGNLDNPYSEQASLQLSQELPGGVAVTAGYLFVHGVKLVGLSANLNGAPTAPPPGSPLTPGKTFFGARRFRELGDISFLTNIGDSAYHGGTLEVEKRFGLGLGIHGSYTFSKTMSDGGTDAPSSITDNEDPGVSEWALSRQHLAHRFTLSLLEQVPNSVPVLRDFKFSSLVAIESGRPFTVFAGLDANGDGNPLSDRPGNLNRNTLIGPRYASVDVRVARPIKLTERLSSEFSIDFFNLFNRVNIRDINTFYGGANLNLPPAPGFATPRDVFNPRQIQFAVKLKY